MVDDLRCDCRHCDNHRAKPLASGNYSMLKDGDRGHSLRAALMPCGKKRVPEFDVKHAPRDTGLREAYAYAPNCCGLELISSDEDACENCGFEATVGDFRPSEAADKTFLKVHFFSFCLLDLVRLWRLF